MPADSFGRRRPRPVADAPQLDGTEVARAWLVELVARAPLDRAATLPGPAFADGAPRLCGAILAALASDAAFDDLEPGGALAPTALSSAALAGARDAAEAATALEALRSVTWALLVEALHRPPQALLVDLADRLGAAIATVTAATLEANAFARAPTRAAGAPAGDPGAPPPDSAAPPTPLDAAGRTPPDPVAPSQRPVVEDGGGFHARAAPWTAAVERRLERYASDGLPFAVMCVEVADLDRLVAAERDGEVALALEAAEAAVCAQLRPADVLVRERPGRYWLVAPETDAEAARSLAHLLAAAVAGVNGHRGVPLETAVGVASCPVDGHDAATLEGRAEEGLFAARAAGVRVTGSPRR